MGEKTAVKLINEFGTIENLISKTNELKGALKTKIESHIEDIKMSKFLATIKTDVPIELRLDELKISEPNQEELGKLMDELEFKSLKSKILKKSENIQKPVNGQLDLFAEFAPEGSKEPEFSNLETLKTVVHDYQLIENEEDLLKLRDFFLTKEILSLDTETTSTNAIDAELVGLSFAVEEHQAFYVPIPENREEAQKRVEIFRSVYENEKILKIGQNLKYDLEVLRNYDIELKGKMWDTMIAHYLIQPELRHNMDYMAEIYLNYQTIHIDELIGAKGKNQRSMRELDPKEVYEYAAEDADITLQLKNKLEPELKQQGAEKLFYEIEMPLMPVLAEMEMTGVCLDTDSLAETSKQLTQRMLDIEQRIYELAGEHFNIASPKQVGDILFDKLKIIDKAKKTKKGQYVTSEEVLQQLRHKHEIVGLILDHRGLKKLLGTYIEALPKLINPRTGHIHTSFNQTITATGRLSSSDPNLQNIPIRGEDGKEIRKAFIPEPGCLFFSADYSQIELRVMAHLSQDPQMIEVEAKMLIDGYFDTFPQVHDYMEKSKEVARQQGYVTTLFGRRRYLPDINSANSVVRGFAERNAINAPIQGTAADIIKVAMIHIFQRFKTEGIKSKMILQVHDELNFSVYPDEKEKVEHIVLEEMQNAYQMAVPLVADSGFGENWLEAH